MSTRRTTARQRRDDHLDKAVEQLDKVAGLSELDDLGLRIAQIHATLYLAECLNVELSGISSELQRIRP